MQNSDNVLSIEVTVTIARATKESLPVYVSFGRSAVGVSSLERRRHETTHACGLPFQHRRQRRPLAHKYHSARVDAGRSSRPRFLRVIVFLLARTRVVCPDRRFLLALLFRCLLSTRSTHRRTNTRENISASQYWFSCCVAMWNVDIWYTQINCKVLRENVPPKTSEAQGLQA